MSHLWPVKALPHVRQRLSQVLQLALFGGQAADHAGRNDTPRCSTAPVGEEEIAQAEIYMEAPTGAIPTPEEVEGFNEESIAEYQRRVRPKNTEA